MKKKKKDPNQFMTEYQIECWVERQVDSLDKKYMAGLLTTEEYQAKMKKISDTADKKKKIL